MNQAQKAIELTDFKAQKLREELKYLEDAGQIDSASYDTLQTQLIRTESDAVLLKKKLEEIRNLKMDKLSQDIKKVGDGISKAGQVLKPFSVAATGLLASFTAIAATSVSTASKIDDLAQSMGITAEQYQKFDYIAMQTGSSTDRLQRAFVVLRTGVGKALLGETSKSTEALMQLGFTMEDLTKMSQEDIFNTTISRLSEMENETMKVALATQIFNERIVADIMPTLNAGSQAMAELSAEFETLGYMSNEQVESLSKFDDILNRIKTIFANLKNEVGAAMLPMMVLFAEFLEGKIIPGIRKLVDWFTNLSDSQQKLLFGGVALVAGLTPVLLMIGKLTSGIGGLISSTGGLTKVLSLLSAHPVIAIIGVIATLIGVMYAKNEEFRESINNLVSTLGSALMPILEILGSLLSSVLSLIMPIIDLIATSLTPVFDLLATILGILGESLRVGSVQLSIFVKVFELIIKLIKPIIEGLTWVINIINKFYSVLFDGILEKTKSISNAIVGFFENIINWVIKQFNWLIDQANKVAGVFGKEVKRIDDVDFSSTITKKVETTPSKNTTPALSPEQVITQTPTLGYPQSIINTDNSKKDIKIDVHFNNYAAEFDEENFFNTINLKLAEQM